MVARIYTYVSKYEAKSLGLFKYVWPFLLPLGIKGLT